MGYTKGLLERFAADIPVPAIRSAFERAIETIQYDTKNGIEWCVDHQVEEALMGTIAENEIQALRARVLSYLSEEDLGIKGK